MKELFLIKVQSESDVITNSSTELFIVNSDAKTSEQLDSILSKITSGYSKPKKFDYQEFLKEKSKYDENSPEIWDFYDKYEWVGWFLDLKNKKDLNTFKAKIINKAANLDFDWEEEFRYGILKKEDDPEFYQYREYLGKIHDLFIKKLKGSKFLEKNLKTLISRLPDTIETGIGEKQVFMYPSKEIARKVIRNIYDFAIVISDSVEYQYRQEEWEILGKDFLDKAWKYLTDILQECLEQLNIPGYEFLYKIKGEKQLPELDGMWAILSEDENSIPYETYDAIHETFGKDTIQKHLG